MELSNVKTLKQYAAASLAITVEDAKAQCFIVPEDTTQDSYLERLILTAQNIIENDPTIPYVFFKTQFAALYSSDRPRMLLPKSPVLSLDSVAEFDGEKWNILDNSQYTLETGDRLDFAVLKTPPAARTQIKIEFTAGNETAETIPLGIKQTVAALVSHLYEYRGLTTTQTLANSPVYNAIVGSLRRTSF